MMPEGCMRLGEFTYRHRGQVDFQVRQLSRWVWHCGGFGKPVGLADRAFSRRMADTFGSDSVAADPVDSLVSVVSDTGWIHMTKRGTVRAVCRSIDRALRERDDEDRRYLEAKGTGARL